MEPDVSNQPYQPDRQAMQNAQKAAEFFAQSGLSRLVAKLYEKYIDIGQVGGQVMLEHCTLNERRDISSFLGKPLYPDTTIKVRLADVEKALYHSFNCTLPDLLRAYFPDQPLVTRAERRAKHATHQAHFRSALTSITVELPETSRGRYWLEQGLHGQEWLFSRYKNAPAEEQERQLQLARYIANLLNQLPRPDAPQRLALFAQRTSGDPHTLDPAMPAGRLLLLALNDLNHNTTDINLTQRDRAQELRFYSEAGLLVDTISSSVAVFNLASAVYHNGVPDQLPLAAGQRVLLLPLSQLLEWQHSSPSRPHIYVIENPQVFEEVVSALKSDQPLPTCVCTSGWPSRASLVLLDQFLAASPANTLYYSGDFDLKGLQIAAYLIARYPARCHPWRFDPDSYIFALQSRLETGLTATHPRPNELDILSTLPAIFAPLVAMMQEKKTWAYQEGIARLLVEDILGCGV
jgi:uncharacterized protein (TIGR02679 family)